MSNTPTPPNPPFYRSRQLMMDILSYPVDDEGNPVEQEEFLKVQVRFEKLIHYVKFYIKKKEEKRAYTTPREHEMNRLNDIDEALVSNPYLDKHILGLHSYHIETFDCRASEFHPKFLFDTLVSSCLKQLYTPDNDTQLAQDVTRFYEEIFIPEGGVPLLQQHGLMVYKFFWVLVKVTGLGIGLSNTWIDLKLTSPKENNGSSPNLNPQIKVRWIVSSTVTPTHSLIEFERFYDERANGFKRQANALGGLTPRAPKRLAHEKANITGDIDPKQIPRSTMQPREKDQETKDLEVAEKGLVEVGMVDHLEATKLRLEEKDKETEDCETEDCEVEEEGSVEVGLVGKIEGINAVESKDPVEKGNELVVELGADALQGAGNSQEFEEKEKELSTEKWQEQADMKTEELQGAGNIDFYASKAEPAAKPKIGKPQETITMEIEAQKVIQLQTGGEECKLKKNKGKAESLEVPRFDNTNQAQPREDTRVNIGNTNQVQQPQDQDVSLGGRSRTTSKPGPGDKKQKRGIRSKGGKGKIRMKKPEGK